MIRIFWLGARVDTKPDAPPCRRSLQVEYSTPPGVRRRRSLIVTGPQRCDGEWRGGGFVRGLPRPSALSLNYRAGATVSHRNAPARYARGRSIPLQQLGPCFLVHGRSAEKVPDTVMVSAVVSGVSFSVTIMSPDTSPSNDPLTFSGSYLSNFTMT